MVESTPRRALVLYSGHMYAPLSLMSAFLPIAEKWKLKIIPRNCSMHDRLLFKHCVYDSLGFIHMTGTGSYKTLGCCSANNPLIRDYKSWQFHYYYIPLSVPSSTIQIQTMNIRTILWWCILIINWQYFKIKGKLLNWNRIFPGIVL